MQKHKLLIVDDEENMLKAYKAILKNAYDLVLIDNGQDAVEKFKNDDFSVVLLDVIMSGINGIDVLQRIKDIDKNIEVIMITASHDVKSAVQAIKLGAYDYIIKPFESDDLISVIEKVIEKKSLAQENTYLRRALEEKEDRQELIGESELSKNVFDLVNKVAFINSTVLISGESGTGKEVIAYAIHKRGPRANKPFMVVNCAAVPETLIESELFGYERGAFTGALERKEGKFELAHGGTLFLDEIGCMKPVLQTKLLRVLQNNIIERVGGGKPIWVDVRIVAATNVDLEEAIKKGEFREDLFYRLNVIRIHLPPLRDRRKDIPIFLKYFLGKYNKEFNKKIKGFSKGAIKLLSGYGWPGNVRELQNLVERLVALSENNDYILVEDIPLENSCRNIIRKSLKEAQMDFERRYIKNVLIETGGNQTKAAGMLGIHRTTLISKMDQLSLK